MMTPTTRRHPRSLSEAFGPYHHLAPLETEYAPLHKHDKIVLCGCAIALAAIAIIALVF
jgi:hypothetical protein